VNLEGNGLSKKKQILVSGNNEDTSTPELEKLAYEAGVEIAKSDCVLVSGGLGGIMKASCKGVHDQGGISVGIIPQNDFSYANEFCDIVIPSGMGFTRDFLTALSADGVIVIGGGAGTLSEICAAYMHKKPIVAIRNTSPTIDKFVDQYIDSRNHTKLVGVNSPKEAVKYILEQITS